MLRRYTREKYLDVVARLRQAIPGITLSTDIIVGFPGETDEEFAATLSLVEEVQFDDGYTFRYSVRAGTPAERITGHLPDRVAQARLEQLIETVRGVVRRKHLGRIGSTHEILVERPAKRGDFMLGRTRTNLMVLVDLPRSSVGEYHQVQLTGTTGSTFTGAITVPQLAVL
jgi:tRNA-2-methylthio-N6-dimethylallyladenosine synthase